MVCAALLLVAGGCGRVATLDLMQPHLSGWQQHLHLTTESAWWSPGNKDDRLLVEFPPPGAATGRPLVILYLRWPAGQTEPTVAAPSGPTVAAPSGPTARGFFIQTRGQYAGLSSVVAGSILIRGRARSAHAARQIKLDLRCEDGSILAGNLTARRDDHAINVFETRRRPVDVKMLARDTGLPATGTGR